MATLEVVNLNYSWYKTTTLTQYANLGHVKELLEKKHPATTDARCKYENYTITSIQGFLRIRAPEALTVAEIEDLYKRGSNPQSPGTATPIRKGSGRYL